MVSVQLRNMGDGLWSRFSLPISVQVAQTLAGAARTLNLADQIRIQPAEPPLPRPNGLDVRV
jgi:hypothetical protein